MTNAKLREAIERSLEDAHTNHPTNNGLRIGAFIAGVVGRVSVDDQDLAKKIFLVLGIGALEIPGDPK